MKRVHQVSGRALLVSGAFLVFIILMDIAGTEFPRWLSNGVFAVFGLSLTVFAFTYKRWAPEDPPPPPSPPPTDTPRND